jgi:ethanolamine utilization protein EutA (predicted chaperonin)
VAVARLLDCSGAADTYAVFDNTTMHDTVCLNAGEGFDRQILQLVSGREVVLVKNHRTAVIEMTLSVEK